MQPRNLVRTWSQDNISLLEEPCPGPGPATRHLQLDEIPKTEQRAIRGEENKNLSEKEGGNCDDWQLNWRRINKDWLRHTESIRTELLIRKCNDKVIKSPSRTATTTTDEDHQERRPKNIPEWTKFAFLPTTTTNKQYSDQCTPSTPLHFI